jgi:hypothetical protein
MKFYVVSGSVRWIVGGCVSSRHAAQRFVQTFVHDRLRDIDDAIVVGEAGFRSEYARDAEVFDLGEILRAIKSEGGSDGTIK